MKSQNYFKEGKNNIGYVGDNFKEHFYDMEFPTIAKCNLKTNKLERSMTDKEILAEFKPKEATLGELVYALENNIFDKENYNANIFYIRDKDNVLWAVDAYWRSGRRYWCVYAYSVGNPHGWRAGFQVVSSDWDFEPKNSDTLNLEHSDAVKVTEIEYMGRKYKLSE